MFNLLVKHVLIDTPFEVQASADQRARLMMSTERLGRTTDRLKDSRRTMMETEEIGVSILQDLHGQRQSLLRAGDTVLALHFIYYMIGAL